MFKEPDLSQYNNFLVFPHVKPDGDAIGSSVAMYHALRDMGKKVTLVNDDVIPAELRFLSKNLYSTTQEVLNDGIKYDFCIVVDSSNIDRLGQRLQLTENLPIWNIDHHKTNSKFGDFHTIVGGASSTCEIVYNLLLRLDAYITSEIAEALYTGISTDTGSFKYESTRPSTLRIAANLIEVGFDRDNVIQNLYHSSSTQKLALEVMAMQNITYLADGRAAIICITKEMLEKTGADMTMSEGIVEMIRDIDSVDLAVLLKEQDDSEIKVSMRSKRSIDVSGMALQNGGGGHARASGFSINNTNMGEALIFMKKLISENI